MMLQVVSKEDAVNIIRKQAEGFRLKTQKVGINEALGRTVSSDIIAYEDIPAFDRSTVDGYAVCAEDTFGAGEAVPAELTCVGRIKMGLSADFEIKRGQCAEIYTGGMLPKGANAVVMVENTLKDDEACLVYSAVSPMENVTLKGADIRFGNVAVKKGTKVTHKIIGILAALGIYEVPVFEKPLVAVISTGDELVDGTPEAGQIRDINTYMLCACAKNAGCEVLVYGNIKDSRALIFNAVKDCIEKADAVLISGGSSAGNMDMTADILNELGKIHFHGIAVKPGKPTIFATADNKPVFGLPGHPLAAYFVFRLFVNEYLKVLFHQPEEKPYTNAKISKNIPSNHGREEFVCVKLSGDGFAHPVYTKSGIISVLSDADGFICIPRQTEGIAAGTEVEIYSL